MLLIHWKMLIIPCVVILGLVFFSAIFAYRTNANRTPDDPEKKDFSPNAIWLVPVTFLFLILLDALAFILFSLAFGSLLVVFPFALLLFRKPFLVQWILKQALKIGTELLEVNTALLRKAGFYRPVRI